MLLPDSTMRDPIEQYLEDVLCYADLSWTDERSVRAELSEHLHELAKSFNPPEVYAMLKDQFGAPKIVGSAIAAAKGRARTWFKKRARKLPLKIAVALILAFTVRYAVAEEFYVAGKGVSPVIPLGSRVFVYKLAKYFSPGDIVVYKNQSGETLAGIIVRADSNGGYLIERNEGKEVHDVPSEKIVGRVFLNTR
jgi:hypothetical protein